MTTAQLAEQEVDPATLAKAIERLKAQQNMPKAVIAGVVAAILGGLIWAAVTIITNFQIGWMAVGVGLLVGLAVRQGHGIEKRFGVVGAVLAP